MPPSSKLFGADLPPFLTVAEIVVEVGMVASQNLAKITLPYKTPAPPAE
jgi:hypothetical protein